MFFRGSAFFYAQIRLGSRLILIEKLSIRLQNRFFFIKGAFVPFFYFEGLKSPIMQILQILILYNVRSFYGRLYDNVIDSCCIYCICLEGFGKGNGVLWLIIN